MHIKGIPLFLMFHRIVGSKEHIISDYDIKSEPNMPKLRNVATKFNIWLYKLFLINMVYFNYMKYLKKVFALI